MSHPLLISVLAGPKNTGPDFGKASPVGLFVVVLLLIGVFALVWSMNRHLKRIPESFDAPAEAPTGSAAEAAVDSTSAPGASAESPQATTELKREPSSESGG